MHDQGVVAITNHSSVELVLLSAGAYQSLLDTLTELQARVLAARGKSRKAPTAGTDF